MSSEQSTQERRLPFFFYGTLKPGGVNYVRYRMSEVTLSEQPASLARAGLYTDGTFPFVVVSDDASPEERVLGFVMTLADEHYARMLVELDDLEEYVPGAPAEQSWLVREVLTVTLDSGEPVEVWIYLAGPAEAAQIASGKRTRIDSGDWPIDWPPLPE